MNEEQKPTVYPEQEKPARPSYDAIIRGVPVGGWLYYHQTEGTEEGHINIVVTIQGNHVHAEDFFFSTPEERSKARRKAKGVWQRAVIAVIAGV
jgi:hypothetical protein